MEYNRIIQGNNIVILPAIPRKIANCIVTSPPYWGLRDYGNKPEIWDGDKDCEHDFKAKAGFCSKCGAWRGSFGLEPTIELYIKHLCDIFDEAKEVLRDDGTCWVNLGDSYDKKKSLCLIPQRFAIEMVNRGWILRNTIIWHKPNGMPASAKNRFTVDFEYIYFFSKSNKTLFWTNEKTFKCTRIKPPGTKGIEGLDWEWRTCPKCQGEGIMPEEALKEDEPNICPRCKGSGEIKYSFWRGHDYWFEQQYEKFAPDTLPRRDRGLNVNKWTKGADGQTPHNLSQPRPNKKRAYKTKQMSEEIRDQQHHGSDIDYGEHGRNRRCVWTIATKSFKEAHFATFPETLIKPIIQAGCPKYICKKCGMARVKIYKIKKIPMKFPGGKPVPVDDYIETNTKGEEGFYFKKRYYVNRKEIGYTDCGCNAGFENGVTLDLFMGAGTTGAEAKKQGKRYLGIEIKKEYINMANKRINKIQETLF